MAYDADNPPSLIAQGTAAGGRQFIFEHSDSLATVMAAGYIANAVELGLRVGDSIKYKRTVDGVITDEYDLMVTDIGASGTGTMGFPAIPLEMVPDGGPVNFSEDTVTIYQDGVLVQVPVVAISGVVDEQVALDVAASAATAVAAKDAALIAETNAETAETNAETAASAASTSQTNAATSASNASSSASSASTSASTASTHASTASTQATNAATSASAAAVSAAAAAASAITAAGHASTASTHKTAAQTAQTAAELAEAHAETAEAAAEQAETNADTSADIAVSQAGVATAQAVLAAASASAASSSASTASSSQSAAAASATTASGHVTSAAAQVTLAQTAKTAAELAETNAETAQAAAELARDEAEAAVAAVPTIASQAEAEAGTENTHFTTPLRVKQGITAVVGAISAYGKTVIDDANAAAARATLEAAGSAITISAGGLATGGGDLTTNRTVTVTAASQAEAEAGASTTVTMTPLRTKQLITVELAANVGTVSSFGKTLIGSADAAAARTEIEAVHTGFTINTSGLISGGGDLSATRTFTVTEATQVQAEAGTASTGVMTPRRVTQQIAADAVIAAKALKATTVSAAGLATGGGDLSANRTITVTAASQAEAEAGVSATTVMTPLGTAQAIAAQGLGSASAFMQTVLDDADAATARATLAAAGSAITISAAGLATGGGSLAANRTVTVTASSQAEAEAGTNTSTAMTPQRAKQAIDFNVGTVSTFMKTVLDDTTAAAVRTTIGAPSSATTVTGAGLASGGGAISSDQVITVTGASQAEAEAGASNTVVMTPLRAKQATDAAFAANVGTVSAFVKTIFNDADGPAVLATIGGAASATTMTAAGLVTGGGSLAANRTFTVTAASAAEAQALTSTSTVITPSTVGQSIFSRLHPSHDPLFNLFDWSAAATGEFPVSPHTGAGVSIVEHPTYGRVLQIQDDEDTWSRKAYRIDTTHTYRLRARVLQSIDAGTPGTSGVSIGVWCLDKDFAQLGTSSNASRYFLGASNYDLDGVENVVTFEGVITGEHASTETMFAVGTVYARIYILCNSVGGDGTFQLIEMSELEDITAAAANINPFNAPDFQTKALAAAYTPTTAPNFIRTAEHTAGSGVGGCCYAGKTTSDPGRTDQLSIVANGVTTYYLPIYDSAVDLAIFGLQGTGDETTLFNAAVAVAESTGLRKITMPRGKTYQTVRSVISGDLEIDLNGGALQCQNNGATLPSTSATLLKTLGGYATGTVTFSGAGTAGNTVTIDGKVYTIRATPGAEANAFKLGATAALSAAALIAAINLEDNSGGLYGTETLQHTTIRATEGTASHIVSIVALVEGEDGDAITMSEVSSAMTVPATLSGGVEPIKIVLRNGTIDGNNDVVTVNIGEPILSFVGGSEVVFDNLRIIDGANRNSTDPVPPRLLDYLYNVEVLVNGAKYFRANNCVFSGSWGEGVWVQSHDASTIYQVTNCLFDKEGITNTSFNAHNCHPVSYIKGAVFLDHFKSAVNISHHGGTFSDILVDTVDESSALDFNEAGSHRFDGAKLFNITVRNVPLGAAIRTSGSNVLVEGLDWEDCLWGVRIEGAVGGSEVAPWLNITPGVLHNIVVNGVISRGTNVVGTTASVSIEGAASGSPALVTVNGVTEDLTPGMVQPDYGIHANHCGLNLGGRIDDGALSLIRMTGDAKFVANGVTFNVTDTGDLLTLSGAKFAGATFADCIRIGDIGADKDVSLSGGTIDTGARVNVVRSPSIASFSSGLPIMRDGTMRASAAFNILTTGAGATTSTTLPVPGAAVGDFVRAFYDADMLGMFFDGLTAISAPDTATVVFRNPTAGSLNPAAGTLTVLVTPLL